MTSVKEIFLENFAGVQRGTDFILKAVPKDKVDFTLVKDGQKMGDLARHISLLPFTSTLFIEKEFKERPSPEQMKNSLADHFGPDLYEGNFSTMFRKSCEYFLTFCGKKTDSEIVGSTFTNFIYATPISSGVSRSGGSPGSTSRNPVCLSQSVEHPCDNETIFRNGGTALTIRARTKTSELSHFLTSLRAGKRTLLGSHARCLSKS